jgi:phosphate transport system protein
MSTPPQKVHISTQFNVELESLRQRLLAMGGLVEQQLAQATRALVEGDPLLAEGVKSRESEIDNYELEIDEECCVLLARRQPAAVDLRLVYSMIKASTDLQRIGAEAGKIASMAIDLGTLDPRESPMLDLAPLARHVVHILHDALDAFARMDDAAAEETADHLDTVDREYEALMRQCMTYMMEDPRNIRHAMDLLWSLRALERIDLHARNIADYVIYLVQGKAVRHRGAEVQ